MKERRCIKICVYIIRDLYWNTWQGVMSLHRLVIALFLLQLSDSFSLPAKQKGKQIKELAAFLLCHPKETTDAITKKSKCITRSLAPNSNKKMHTIILKFLGNFFTYWYLPLENPRFHVLQFVDLKIRQHQAFLQNIEANKKDDCKKRKMSLSCNENFLLEVKLFRSKL